MEEKELFQEDKFSHTNFFPNTIIKNNETLDNEVRLQTHHITTNKMDYVSQPFIDTSSSLEKRFDCSDNFMPIFQHPENNWLSNDQFQHFSDGEYCNTPQIYQTSSSLCNNLNKNEEEFSKLDTSNAKSLQLLEDGTDKYVYVLLPVKNEKTNDDVEMDGLPIMPRTKDEQKQLETDFRSNSLSKNELSQCNGRDIYQLDADSNKHGKSISDKSRNNQVSKPNRKFKKSKVKYFLTPGEDELSKSRKSISNASKLDTSCGEIKSSDELYSDLNKQAQTFLLTDDNNNNSNDIEFKLEESFNEAKACIMTNEEEVSNHDITFNEIVSKRTLREKMLPPEIRGKRRQAANARERKRVNKITDAFERLREHVPNLIKDRKLSKFETLQMAMAYIDALDKGLRVDVSAGLESAPLLTAASRARIVVAQSSAKWRLQRWLENKLGMSQKLQN